MGNIYSELGRSFKSIRSNKSSEHQDALARAIDVFIANVEVLINKRTPKVREALRAKEIYLNLIKIPDTKDIDIQNLERYFMQFAIATRLRR